MEELLPHQKEQLTNWSIQRDALLGEISVLNQEKNKLSKQNSALVESATEISMRIEKLKGTMEELDNQEKLYMEIVDSKLPGLEVEKTKLETAVSTLIKDVAILESKKEELTKDIMFLITTHEDVYQKTGALEKIVDHVAKINSENVKLLDNAVVSMTGKVNDILKLSDEQYKAHTDVLTEIPRLFVELRKKSLIREKI